MNNKKTIVDVRTPEEFRQGHVEGSINIPLQEVQQRFDELKSLQPLILCCASGARSGQATAFLRGNNIECENGGSWFDVSAHYQQA